jgi:hypothetical protein
LIGNIGKVLAQKVAKGIEGLAQNFICLAEEDRLADAE